MTKIGHIEELHCEGCGIRLSGKYSYNTRGGERKMYPKRHCADCTNQLVPKNKILEIVESVRIIYHDGSTENDRELSIRAGFKNQSYISNVRDRRQSIRFRLADQVLTTLGLVDLWRSDEELREIYWQGNVPPDGSKPMLCIECNEWTEVPEDIDEFRCESCR